MSRVRFAKQGNGMRAACISFLNTRRRRAAVQVALAIVLVAGCKPQEAANGKGQSATGSTDTQSPKFEAEFVQYRPNGTRSIDRLHVSQGDSHKSKETHTDTEESGATITTEFNYNIRFEGHRNGKDVYVVDFNAKPIEVEYEGKRIEVAEVDGRKFVLQPRGTEPLPEGLPASIK